LSFQKMQVDTQPLLANIIELVSKKVLVQPEVADKCKGKTLPLVILARRIYHKEGLLGKLQTERLISPETPGGRLNRVTEQSSMTRASRTIQHLRTNGLVLMQTIRLTQLDNLSMARGIDLHTKRRRGCKGKAHVTHMVGWSKTTLLLINSSPNTLTRRLFYAIGQQRNPGQMLKHNAPKGGAASIVYPSISSDARIIYTRLLIVDMLLKVA
jgi:hypothetical protein